MANDINQNFREFLKADSTIQKLVGSRIHEDKVPKLDGLKTEPFIWFARRQTIRQETLDSQNGELPGEVIYDLECAAGNQFHGKQLAAALEARCSCYRGTFGDSTAKGMFVRDQDDDYIPKAGGGDTGVFVAAFDVQVFV